MLNDVSSPLSLLATRRSGKPREMIAPGPSKAQLGAMLETAMRVPDHGKLAPWRMIVIEDRERFTTLLTDALKAEKAELARGDLDAVREFAHAAPTLIVVLSSPVAGKIPRWEQELSAGALCMNLLLAAHAHGFAGGWITGWAAYSPMVQAAFGEAEERIAGFVFIGTPARPLEERPRPDIATVVSQWG